MQSLKSFRQRLKLKNWSNKCHRIHYLLCSSGHTCQETVYCPRCPHYLIKWEQQVSPAAGEAEPAAQRPRGAMFEMSEEATRGEITAICFQPAGPSGEAAVCTACGKASGCLALSNQRSCFPGLGNGRLPVLRGRKSRAAFAE